MRQRKRLSLLLTFFMLFTMLFPTALLAEELSAYAASNAIMEQEAPMETPTEETAPMESAALESIALGENEEAERMSEWQEPSFADVSTTNWFYRPVAYVYEKGLMSGITATQFAPYDGATRAMVVNILWRMAGCPVVNYAMPFTDVAEAMWYTEAIRWAASTGIVAGVSENEFAPNANVTRESLATIIYRYEKQLGEGFVGAWVFLLPQNDARMVSGWADEAMHWCIMKGVLQGDEHNNLNPQQNATRAEIATIFMNLDRVED